MKLEELEAPVVNAILTALEADVNIIEHYLFNLLSVCKEYDRDFEKVCEYFTQLKIDQVNQRKRSRRAKR